MIITRPAGLVGDGTTGIGGRVLVGGGVGVNVGVFVRVKVAVAVLLGVGVCVKVCVAVGVNVFVAVNVGVAVLVAVLVAVGVVVGEFVGVSVGGGGAGWLSVRPLELTTDGGSSHPGLFTSSVEMPKPPASTVKPEPPSE